MFTSIHHYFSLITIKMLVLFIVLHVTIYIDVKELQALEITNEKTKLASQKIKESIQLLLQSQYLESIEQTKEVQAMLPEHPAGYFYEAGITEWMMTACRNYRYEDSFKEKIAITIKKAKAILKEDPYDAWMYHYIGGANGFLGVYYTTHGNWYSAFTIGTTGYNQLKYSLKLNPYIYDNYYGIGLYLYYKGAKSKNFSWLLFADANQEKNKGLAHIQTAISSSFFIKKVAFNAMTEIYIAEGQYDESIAHAKKVLSQFNNSYLAAFWALAYANKKIKNYQASLENYERIRDFFDNNEKLANQLVYTELNYKQGLIYYYLNNLQVAENYLQVVLVTRHHPDKRKSKKYTYEKKAIKKYKVRARKLMKLILQQKKNEMEAEYIKQVQKNDTYHDINPIAKES